MPVNTKETKEKKSLTGQESVESLIKGRQAEKSNESAQVVSEATGQVQESVAGVLNEGSEGLAGMEKPSDRVSEGVREKKGESGGAGTSTTQSDDDDAQQIVQNLKKTKEPTKAAMIKMVRKAIEADIQEEFGKQKKLINKLSTGGAEEYAASVARVRSLKESLTSLLNGTLDLIKNFYNKYFTPEGQRRVSN